MPIFHEYLQNVVSLLPFTACSTFSPKIILASIISMTSIPIRQTEINENNTSIVE